MYDIIIIGGGPAGLSAGIYISKAKKSVLLLEKSFFGGQMATTPIIENYPGFVKTDGVELTGIMKKQAKFLGLEVKREEVVKADLAGKVKTIYTNKAQYQAKSVIIAAGAYARQLEVENEKKYIGKGISYCATCDGSLYKNKTIAIVGGGRTSIEDCFYLKDIVGQMYLIFRREEFRADAKQVDELYELEKNSNGKFKILTNTVVTNISGQETLNGVTIKNNKTDQVQNLALDGLFVAVGRKPDTDIFAEQLQLDKTGYIVAGEDTKTNLNGVFAAGDVRTKSLRQIVTACSDGAIAGTEAVKFLNETKE